MDIRIVGQCIGIVAMIFNILSYQQKKQFTLIVCQLFGSSLFAVSFFMLNSPVGALLNALAAVRAVLFICEEKVKARHPLWLGVFVAIYIAFYVMAFTVFGVEPKWYNFLVELLPIIGMTALSIGFMKGSSKDMRRVAFVSSPCWLCYNIYSGSIGAIMCEVFCFTSTIIGVVRHDIKREKEERKSTVE